MKKRVMQWVGMAVAVFVVGLGCSQRSGVRAAEGLSQAEAEKVTSNIYVADCHPPQTGLTRTVVLGTPNPNGHIREQYGAVMVYPVQVTWTGSCSGHPVGPNQTDFYANVTAKYQANYWKDSFGNWSHTPFVGTCRRVHAGYQPNGQARVDIPGAAVDSCGIADTVND